MKCFVCTENNWENHYEKLVKCKNCGFVRAKDKYFNINPNKLYDLDYFSGIDYENYQDERDALIANFKNRIERIKKIKKRGKLLEIGCAFGYFLHLAEKHYKSSGIDLDRKVTKTAKKNAKKSTILTGEFLNTKFRKESFDVVTMFDVIEHLKNPDKYIKKINRILKENGVIVIETGDIEAMLPKIQKSKWRLITPPTHLSYFSKKTLKRLLSKNGFKILDISYVSFYRTIKQTVYRLTRNKPLANLFKKITLSFPINTYDLIFIIAKKIN